MAVSTEDSFVEAELIVKVEDMLMADPALSCENALNQAPFVISSLGHLLLISLETDFSLIAHLPENTKLKHLNYPNSFRACLMQVSHGVWQAFENAHLSMDQIHWKSLSIDQDVKKAVRIIQEGTENELPIVLSCLASVDQQSNECVKAAASITKEFEVIVDTMKELVQVCTVAKGRYENERKESISAREAAAEKQKHVEKGIEDINLRCDEKMGEIKKAKKNYDKAVNSYPSFLKLMLGRSLDQIVRWARDNTVSLTVQMLLPMRLFTASNHTTPKEEKTASPAKPTISDDEVIAYLAASDILNHAELLLSFAYDFANNDQIGIEMVLEWFQKNLEKHRESQSDAVAVKKAVKLCKDGVERCQDVLNCLKKLENTDRSAATRNPTKRTYDEVTKNRLNKCYKDAMSFNKEATKALSNLDRNGNDDVGPVTWTLLENTRQQKEAALEILNSCYESYDHFYNQMLRERKEMEKVLDELAKFDHRTLDLDKIQAALRKGMEALVNVLKHWKRFQEMFQSLRGLISNRFRPCLDRFHSTAKAGVENFQQIEESLTKKIIIEESKEASEIVSMVNSVSVLYLDVSKKYLLDEMINLQDIVYFDAEHDREKIENTRRAIEKNCKRAQDSMRKLVEERKKELREKTTRQQENNDEPVPALGRDKAKGVQPFQPT